MRPARFLPGTKGVVYFERDSGKPVRPGAPGARLAPSDYTDKQFEALEALKQTTPALKFGAARAEFANKVLLADGTVSGDLDAVREAARAALREDQLAYRDFEAKHAAAIAKGDAPVALLKEAVALRGHAKHDLADELEQMLAQQRFLIIVDCTLVPRIYFQCAVEGNPDVQLADVQAADAPATSAAAEVTS